MEGNNLYNELQEFNEVSFSKTYLSPKIYNHFSSHNRYSELNLPIFNEANIFQSTDLIKHNIYPFNYNFKNSSKNKLIKPNNKMYSYLIPKYYEINDEYFSNIFLVENLLILNSEIDKINSKNYEILFKAKSNKDEVLLLKRKNNFKVFIKDENILNLNNVKCEKFETVNCFLKEKKNFNFTDEIILERESLNNYVVKNLSREKLNFILPFLYDKNWHSESSKISYLQETFMYITLKPEESVNIYYKDKTRLTLKIISIFAFFILILLIVKKKFFSVHKSSQLSY